jgi:hypothetical protein
LLPKFEAILPVSGAKGQHVYMASSTTTGLTSQLLAEIGTSDEHEDDYYVASGSTKIGASASDEKINGGNRQAINGDERAYPAPKGFSGVSEVEAMMMDVDIAQVPTTLSAASATGKRKFSALRNEASVMSSSPSTEPTATSEVSVSEPAGKRRSTGTGHSIGKDRKPRKVSARKAAEISNATVLHGMQGTMNRVTDIFEKSLSQPLDPQSAVRTEALHFLQTREDNLSLDDTNKVVQLFMKDSIAAETYVALVNDNLRKRWLASMLEEMALPQL